jgi:hypothetical protein
MEKMMNEEPKENQGLLDDDPALDFILYEEMVKDEQQRRGKGTGGCLSLILLMVVPLGGIYLLVRLLAA